MINKKNISFIFQLKINEGFFGELIAVIFIASLFDNMPIAIWNIENG